MKNILEANKRMIVLQALKGDNDYSLNNGILQRILVQFGHGIGLAGTDTVIDWLEFRGLVTVETLDDNLKVAKLTRHGLDVASGHEQVEGVERPGLE